MRLPSWTRWLLVIVPTLAVAVVIALHRPSSHPRRADGVAIIAPALPRFTPPPPAPPRLEEEDRRWNSLYGKVLSGTGTLAEIDAYYDHLKERSEGALRQAQDLLAGGRASERDRALLELAARMNRDRLASLPGEREQALARQRLQEERRRSWTTMAPGP